MLKAILWFGILDRRRSPWRAGMVLHDGNTMIRLSVIVVVIVGVKDPPVRYAQDRYRCSGWQGGCELGKLVGWMGLCVCVCSSDYYGLRVKAKKQKEHISVAERGT